MDAAKAWPRQPFVGIALSAIAGVLAADVLPFPGEIGLAACVGGAGCAAILVRRSLVTYGFAAAAFFALHELRLHDSPAAALARLTGNAPTAVTVRGFVATQPKVSARGIATFTIALRQIEIDGVSHATSARALVRWKQTARYGDEVHLFGTAEPIPPPRNPGEFDMRAYLARHGVNRQLFIRYPENGRIVRHTTGNLIIAAADRTRTALQAILTRDLDDSPDVQAAITGMALGVRHQTPQDIEEPFQQTGTLHLFAVAGLHVAIVAQLLWIVARLARLGRKWSTGAIIVALFFYSAVTGLHTSSVRAAIMSAVLLSGYFVERKVFALNSVAAAAVLILCWDTNEVFGVGFQLSFAVVTTIVLIADPLFRLLRKTFAVDPFLPRSLFSRFQRARQAIWSWFARGLSVSAAAWIGALVPMLAYYNLVTPISLIANLAVVPLAFFVLAAALTSAVAAAFSGTISVLFNNANWLLTRGVLALVQVFAQVPMGHWYVEHPHRPSHALLELTALDVGTGGAVHVRSGGRDWLIDAGARRDFNRTTREYLRFRGVNRLNALLLTHADAGHIGGARDVIDVFHPQMIAESAAPARSAVNRELAGYIASSTAHHEIARAGTEWRLGRDVHARVLFPPADFRASSADDQAIVLQFFAGGKCCALLMSDSGEATERALLDSGVDLRSDVIIKGAHRSGISGTADFLAAVQPKAIVATSRDFPESERLKDEWVASVRARGIQLFRQDETGAVRVLVFRGGRIEVRSYLTSQVFRSSNR